MVVEGGIVSHFYILVICNLIDYMSLFRHSVCFALNFFFLTIFSVEFGICNLQLRIAKTTAEEVRYCVMFCCEPKES